MKRKRRLDILFPWDPGQVSRIPVTTVAGEEVAVSEKGH